MRIYTVHLPPSFSAAAGEALVLREGFNWWAFLFGGLWALAGRMWLLALALLALHGAAVGLELAGVNEEVAMVVTLAVSVWIGCSANDWRRAHLARKGWKSAGIIAAPDRDAALRRYLDLSALGPVRG